MSDLYDDSKDFLLSETTNNLSYFRDNYKWIKFDKLSENLENFNSKKSYDLIFIFETLEHVINEEESIDNLYKLLNIWWKIIVSVPIEYWVLFFIKDLWKRFIIKKDYHSFKELFYWLIWMIDKIKRVPRWHKWYNYKNTKKLLIDKWFKLKEQKIYPFNLWIVWYGVVWVLEK